MNPPFWTKLNLFLVTAIAFALFFLNCGMENNPVDIQSADTIGHEVRINYDQTWSAEQVHVIPRQLVVENATLTIEPGATVKFKPFSSLNILKGAALRAIGTETDSIHFVTEGDSSRKWDFIYFGKDCNQDQIRLEYCIINNGGANDTTSAMIVIEDISPSIKNCIIKNSYSNGILVKGEGGLSKFENNIITLNTGAPLQLPIPSVSTLKKTNSLTGNGVDAIEIVEQGEILSDVEWQPMDVPYHSIVDLTIRAHQLKLLPGVELLSNSGKFIDIGYKSALVAEGTPNAPIRISGIQDNRGSWRGVYIKDSSIQNGSHFSYCEFSNGGDTPFIHSNGNAMPALVFCESVSPSFSNCTFQNSTGYGIVFDRESKPSKFENNQIINNAGPPISILPKALGIIKNNQFVNNEANYIELVSGVISEGGIINNNQIPYRLIGDLNIYYNIVQIEPGTVFQMGPGASISVSANGGLVADGITKANEILFTGAEPINGSWNYLYFGHDANIAFCKLNYCVIEYGGGSLGWPANIYLEGASPQITNCEIRHSRHWGVFLSGNADPNLADTIFEGNFDGDVWPE